jgi:hypothetical protein
LVDSLNQKSANRWGDGHDAIFQIPEVLSMNGFQFSLLGLARKSSGMNGV